MPQALWSACLALQPFAAAVIDPDCAVVAHNGQATDLWSRRSELLHAAGGRLVLADSTAQQQLTRHMRAAPGPARLVLRLIDPKSSKLHWIVVTEPSALAAGAAAPPLLPTDRRFLVSFRLSDEIATMFDPDRLMVDLDITRTEARLAAALTVGLSVNEFAQREGAKVKTVRWHLQGNCMSL